MTDDDDQLRAHLRFAWPRPWHVELPDYVSPGCRIIVTAWTELGALTQAREFMAIWRKKQEST